MNILLTGGAGFIGSHLACALVAADHEVTILDSFLINNILAVEDFAPMHRRILEDRRADLKGARLLIADARDYTTYSPLARSVKPEIIVHLAAVAHQDRAQKNPHSTFDHSLRTLENTLDIAVNSGVRRVVYFSSSTVYGAWRDEAAKTETTECRPFGIYGSLKLAGELMVRAYSNATGLEHVIIRPSALYGPGCISGRVIQRFIEAAFEGQPLNITGGERLDFTHIDDLTDGAVKAILSPHPNETYNITRGEGRAVGEAAQIIATCIPGTAVVLANIRGEFPARGTLDIAKARRMLQYQPRFGIETGIPETIRWYRERGYATVKKPPPPGSFRRPTG